MAPEGSDLSNHRQDQAALTMLLSLYGYSCEPNEARDVVDVRYDELGVIVGGPAITGKQSVSSPSHPTESKQSMKISIEYREIFYSHSFVIPVDVV